METAQIQSAFEDVLDQAIVFHGFTEYLRDYEIVVYATADPRTGIAPEHLSYRFTHCVRASVTSAVRPDVWARSLDERLIKYETGVDLDGYVWGVNSQIVYPGMRLLPPSTETEKWSADIGIPFHEAVIETNAHNIGLVFSDLVVAVVQTGYAPFVVPDGGPDFKIPLA